MILSLNFSLLKIWDTLTRTFILWKLFKKIKRKVTLLKILETEILSEF